MISTNSPVPLSEGKGNQQNLFRLTYRANVAWKKLRTQNRSPFSMSVHLLNVHQKNIIITHTCLFSTDIFYLQEATTSGKKDFKLPFLSEILVKNLEKGGKFELYS